MNKVDYNPYYIMDSSLEYRVSYVLRMAVVMAKKSYPHLAGEMEWILEKYKYDLETFTGSHNKPTTKKSHKK